MWYYLLLLNKEDKMNLDLNLDRKRVANWCSKRWKVEENL